MVCIYVGMYVVCGSMCACMYVMRGMYVCMYVLYVCMLGIRLCCARMCELFVYVYVCYGTSVCYAMYDFLLCMYVMLRAYECYVCN